MEYLYAGAFLVAASVILYTISASRLGFRLACLFVLAVGVVAIVEKLVSEDWKFW